MPAPDSPAPETSTRDGAGLFGDFARKTALVTTVVLGLWLMGAAVQVLLILFLAILFAVFLRSISGWLARHTPLSGRWAVVVAFVGWMGLLSGIIAVTAPSMGKQFEELSKTLPESFERLRSEAMRYEWGRQAADAADEAKDLMPDPAMMIRQVAGIFSSTFGALSVALLILFFGICLALEPETYRRGLLHLVPPRRRDRVAGVLDEVGTVLARWLLSVLMSMSIVGVLTGIGLWLLGIPLVFLLAFLAFLLCFIPNLGPFLAAAPAVLIAFSLSPEKALHVALLYLGIQTVESFFITPLIQRKTVLLPPALTGAAQLVLGLFTGLPGIIVAAPLTATTMVLVRRFYVEDTLGDETVEADEGG